MAIVKYKKVDDKARIPFKAHSNDAGFDLFSSRSVFVNRDSIEKVSTGISLEIPEGYAGFVQSRSGLAAKYHVSVVNSPGLIDCGYRGEIFVILRNESKELDFLGPIHSKIAQLVFVKLPRVELHEAISLNDSERGVSGLGSTGNI